MTDILEHLTAGDWETARRNFERLNNTAEIVGRLTAALNGARVVWGIVNTSGAIGSIVGGTGWFIAGKTGTGDITIQFSTAFSAAPAVLVSPASSAARIGQLHTVTASTARLLGFTTAAAAVEAQLYFVAIGPV